jgi:hypothetical protein
VGSRCPGIKGFSPEINGVLLSFHVRRCLPHRCPVRENGSGSVSAHLVSHRSCVRLHTSCTTHRLHTVDSNGRRRPALAPAQCTRAMKRLRVAPVIRQLTHKNDAVLGVAPNQTARSVATGRCSTALTWDTKCAETEPEPFSRTGQRCGKQRRTWKQNKISFISGENPFIPGHRDPTVPVTQCNGLCHVTHIAGYTSGYTVAITPPRSDCLKRISQSDFESV